MKIPGLLPVLLMVAATGCSSRPDSSATANVAQVPVSSPTPAAVVKSDGRVDLAKLANRPPADFDREFGAPLESKVTGSVEYRLYKVAGNPRGLAVRFRQGRARQFNLFTARPFESARQAISEAFGIDVGTAKSQRDPREPLTETFAGTFGGVSFSKLAAKKEDAGGFVLVFAEIGELKQAKPLASGRQ
jgi:hypothetical protein